MNNPRVYPRDDYKMTEGEIDQAVAAMLNDAGVTLGELAAMGRDGLFDTERQRRAWYTIRSLGRL